jgi:hypothetical protein
MTRLTRRSFLAQASKGVAGGSLVGALAAVPRLTEVSRGAPESPAAAASEPVQGLIAHVRDASTGEIAIMVDTREVIHRDRSLAGRLMEIAHGARGR